MVEVKLIWIDKLFH